VATKVWGNSASIFRVEVNQVVKMACYTGQVKKGSWRGGVTTKACDGKQGSALDRSEKAVGSEGADRASSTGLEKAGRYTKGREQNVLR
jgi:hypothetical protein